MFQQVVLNRVIRSFSEIIMHVAAVNIARRINNTNFTSKSVE